MGSISEEIIRIISDFNQLPYLFIGAGFSKRYISSPSWDELLKNIYEKIYPSQNYNRFLRQIEERIDIDFATLSKEERKYKFNPCLASEMSKELRRKCLNDENFEQSLFTHEEINKILTEHLDYFKYYISKLFSSYCHDNSFLDTDELKDLMAVNNKIAGVITTNYDTVLESIFPEFGQLIGQNELFLSHDNNIFQLYKIHGSCTSPNSIIITNEDYSEFQKKLQYLSAKLLTIFVEHPIIFIGYGIGDLNVRNILDGIALCLTDEQKEQLRHNLLFITPVLSGDDVEEITIKEISCPSGKPLQMTEIKLADYGELYRAFSKIKSSLPVSIIRKMQDMVYHFVSSTTATKNVVLATDINDSSLSGNELGFYVGTLDNINCIGFDFFNINTIIKDILFDDNPVLMNEKILQTFARIKSQAGGTYLPIYKYISELNKTIADIPDDWHIIRSYDDIKPTKSEAQYAKSTPIVHSLSELLAHHPTHTLRQVACIITSRENFSTEDLHSYLCQKYLDSVIWKKNISSMKKLVALYDFKKYGSKFTQ